MYTTQSKSHRENGFRSARFVSEGRTEFGKHVKLPPLTISRATVSQTGSVES